MVNPQRSGPTIERTRLTIKVTNRSWWQLPRQGTTCLLEQHRGRFDGRADDSRAYRRAPAGEFSIWYVFILPASLPSVAGSARISDKTRRTQTTRLLAYPVSLACTAAHFPGLNRSVLTLQRHSDE